MITMLKLTNSEAKKGILHTKSDGEFINQYERKDATFVYNETSYTDDEYISNKYFIYFIESDKGDIFKYNKNCITATIKTDGNYISETADFMFNLFKYLERTKKEIPEMFFKYLSEQLSVLFSIVFPEDGHHEYTSETIWINYKYILTKLGKTLNDFVVQKKIDRFFKILACSHDLDQFNSFSHDELINTSLDTQKLYSNMQYEIKATLNKAIALVADKFRSKEVQKDENNILYVEAHSNDTPCGNIDVHASYSAYGDTFLFYIVMDNKEKTNFTLIYFSDSNETLQVKHMFKNFN